jgi:hypothetical protein
MMTPHDMTVTPHMHINYIKQDTRLPHERNNQYLLRNRPFATNHRRKIPTLLSDNTSRCGSQHRRIRTVLPSIRQTR